MTDSKISDNYAQERRANNRHGKCPHCEGKIRGFSASTERARQSEALMFRANKSLHRHIEKCAGATPNERDYFLVHRKWPRNHRKKKT